MSIEQDIKITIDKAAAQRVEAALDSINAQSQELKSGFANGTVSLDRFAKEMAEADREAQRLRRTLDALEEPHSVELRTDNFDRVSRDVGLAGDVQSNLGAISGLSSTAGLGGVGQGVGAAGEVFALVEELPRLKTAMQGMPATVNAAGAALGTTGAGLIGSLGILAIAAAAVGLAVSVAAKDIERARQSLALAVDATLAAELAVAQGESESGVRARIEALKAEEEANRAAAAQLEEASGAAAKMAQNDWTSWMPGARGLRQEFDELNTSAESAGREAEALQRALDGGRFSAASRKAEEEALIAQAQTLISSETQLADSIRVLEQAMASGRLSTDEQAAAEEKLGKMRKQMSDEMNAEEIANDDRLQALLGNPRKTAEDIAFLNESLESGSLSAEERALAEEKIAALMGETVGEIDKVADSLGRFRADANNIDRNSFGFSEAGFQTLGKRARTDEEMDAKRSSGAATQSGRSRVSEAEKVQQDILELERAAAQQRVKTLAGYSNDLAKIELDQARKLEDIRRQRARDESEAASNRDFAAILNVREQAMNAEAEAGLSATRQAEDRRIALQQQLVEQQQANDHQLAALRAKIQTETSIMQDGYTQAIGLARGFVRGIKREFENGQRGDVGRQVRREISKVVTGS